MFESIANFFKKLMKSESKQAPSKETAKERLHLVLMQDRANVSADFLELMKQEIIEVIKKYIEVEESAIDVRLTKEVKEDGSQGAPSLYANIPILNIKNDMKNAVKKDNEPAKEDKTVGVDDHIDPKKEKKVEAEKVEDNKQGVKEKDEKISEEIENRDENKEAKETDKENKNKEESNQEKKETEKVKETIAQEKSISKEKTENNKTKETKKGKTTTKSNNKTKAKKQQ